MSFWMSVLFAVAFAFFGFCSAGFALLADTEDDRSSGVVGWLLLVFLAVMFPVMKDPSWPIWAPTIGIIVGTSYAIGEILKERRIAKKQQMGS